MLSNALKPTLYSLGNDFLATFITKDGSVILLAVALIVSVAKSVITSRLFFGLAGVVISKLKSSAPKSKSSSVFTLFFSFAINIPFTGEHYEFTRNTV